MTLGLHRFTDAAPAGLRRLIYLYHCTVFGLLLAAGRPRFSGTGHDRLMKIIADANIPGLAQTFGRHGEVRAVDGRSINPASLGAADALIVRSVSRVNAALLAGSRVRFVGTTTIGTDHLDTTWLDQAGIAWASAPGCNADAAAQYTLAMMALACRRLGRELRDQSVGIIGCGNVGGRLQALLRVLDMPVVACDPPLQAGGATGLVSLERALQSSIVSLHVPLTRSGPCPTWRMIDAAALACMPHGALLCNAARGEVVDGTALLPWLQSARGRAALDTWPQEPQLDADLLQATTVATPHVAGYSERGKRNGAWQIYLAFCRQFALRPVARPAAAPPQSLALQTGRTDWLEQGILQACPVRRDDQALRALVDLPMARRAEAFDQLRKTYPPRPEFSGLQISTALSEPQKTLLAGLGFILAQKA